MAQAIVIPISKFSFDSSSSKVRLEVDGLDQRFVVDMDTAAEMLGALLPAGTPLITFLTDTVKGDLQLTLVVEVQPPGLKLGLRTKDWGKGKAGEDVDLAPARKSAPTPALIPASKRTARAK